MIRELVIFVMALSIGIVMTRVLMRHFNVSQGVIDEVLSPKSIIVTSLVALAIGLLMLLAQGV